MYVVYTMHNIYFVCIILFCYLIAEILCCLLRCLFTEDICHMLWIIYFVNDVHKDIRLVNTA